MRALLLVLDSVGVGGAPDAEQYGDGGANTVGHILERQPEIQLPALCALGLPELVDAAWLREQRRATYRASFGRMQERSAGKDTTTGHWELAGVILERPFAVYEKFPQDLVRAIEGDAGVKFLGNYARSGTTILEELGPKHVRTGHPILYTSADSVLQIAAHEDVLAVDLLYQICALARRHADRFRIGRVIARPFAGGAGNFVRTAGRHDFSMKPPRTILNAISECDYPVLAVGKIGDIFAEEGITRSYPTANNNEGMRRIDSLWPDLGPGLIFANLVDFDMLHGHRRDVAGYARALEQFDRWLGEFILKISDNDLVMITADHGNDPTHRGTDHTREQVPLFILGRGPARNLGTRKTFADVAATLAGFFQLPEPWSLGASMLNAAPTADGNEARARTNCATAPQKAARSV